MKILSTAKEIEDFLGINPLQSASIRVTQGCNLKCEHCYAAAGARLENELTMDEVKRILDELKKLGAIRIFFTGGEPFLRKDFVEILKYAESRKFAIYLSTNGTLITENSIKPLKDLNLKVFQVSIDGLEKTHDLIRGVPGSFSKAISALKLAKRNLKNTEIALAFTLMKKNADEVKKLLDLAIQIEIDIFALIPLFPVGRSTKIFDLAPEEKWKVFSDICQFYQTKKSNSKQSGPTRLSILTSQGAIPESLRKTKYGRGFVCTFPNILGINANGGVFPCDGLIGRQEFLLGNIRENSLRNTWNHPLMKKLRAVKPSDLKGVCKECRFSKFCVGGCRAHAFFEYGDFYAPDPLCQKFYQSGLFPKFNLIKKHDK